MLPLSPETPLVCHLRVPGRYVAGPMKTRTLLVLAFLCGMALVIAFTVQILLPK